MSLFLCFWTLILIFLLLIILQNVTFNLTRHNRSIHNLLSPTFLRLNFLVFTLFLQLINFLGGLYFILLKSAHI